MQTIGLVFQKFAVGNLAVLVLACCALAWAHRPARASDGLTVKAMTFNIRYKNDGDGANRWSQRQDAAADVIRRFEGDFVGLQEALPDQVADLLKALPKYRSLGRSREKQADRGEATPILYRHERWRLDAKRHGWFWLSDTPDVPGSTTWGNKLPRVAAWGRFVDVKTGHGVYVYCTHFDNASESARQRSAALLGRRIAERGSDEPVIVLGDFNADESSPELSHLTGKTPESRVKLVDTYRAIHRNEEQVKTFHAFRGGTEGEKIDFILTSPGVKVLSAEILHDRIPGTGKEVRYPSDHYPVTAELSFPAK